MSPVPGFFDYVASAGWPLPVAHPASVEFHRHCADWLDDLGADEIRGKAERARQLAYDKFDYTHLSGKFVQLVESLLQGCA
jgi:hypothetical protein